MHLLRGILFRMKEFSQKYLKFLKDDLGGLNLTRILDDDEFYQKQILDSVIPIQKTKLIKEELEKKKLLIDVGFGGGFPIIPLSYLFPEFKFVGFEGRGKKVNAVQKIADYFKLKNISLFHKRIEEVLIDFEAIITFKAVGNINKLLSCIHSTKTVYVCFYKGPNFLEKEGGEPPLKGWRLVDENEFEIPGTEGRVLLVYKNIGVPRGTSSKNKINLVKLSDLL